MKTAALFFTCFALSFTVPDAAEVMTLKTPNGGIQPKAIVDNTGNLHLIYFKGQPMGGNVFYIKQKKGSEIWSNPLRVNSIANSVVAVGTMRGAQIALGKNNRVHISWNASPVFTKSQKKPQSQNVGKKRKHDPRDNRFMLYTRMNDAGSAFEKQRNVMARTYGLDGGGTVAADGKGNVYVVWHGAEPGSPQGEEGRAVYVAHSSDGGKTFAPEKRANKEDSGACGCCGLSALADGQGKLYVTYRSAVKKINRDTCLLVSQDAGKNFNSSVIDRWLLGACPGSSYALISGPSGVIGSWETNRQVFFSSLGKKPERIAATGPAKGRKNPSIAVNQDGEVLLAWNQGGGWRRSGSLVWQLYDKSGVAKKEHGGVKNGIPVWGMASAVAKADGTFVIFH